MSSWRPCLLLSEGADLHEYITTRFYDSAAAFTLALGVDCKLASYAIFMQQYIYYGTERLFTKHMRIISKIFFSNTVIREKDYKHSIQHEWPSSSWTSGVVEDFIDAIYWWSRRWLRGLCWTNPVNGIPWYVEAYRTAFQEFRYTIQRYSTLYSVRACYGWYRPWCSDGLVLARL